MSRGDFIDSSFRTGFTSQWLAEFAERFHEPVLTKEQQESLIDHLSPYTAGGCLNNTASAKKVKEVVWCWLKYNRLKT